MWQQLWAPWRLPYILGQHRDEPLPDEALDWRPGADQSCFLCRGVASSDDRRHMILHRGPHAVVLLNRFPYSGGHLLVAPWSHKGTLAELTDDEHLDLQRQITAAIARLSELMRPEGFNVGLNLGHVAGAGLPGHLHWHIVPRWSGDTNFMPLLAQTNVIPQALEELWEEWRKRGQGSRVREEEGE